MSDEKIIVEVDPDLEDLIPGFLENRKADVEKLQAELKAGEFANIQSIGHSIKGVGGGYGFERMSELGAAIEMAAKTKDSDQLQDNIMQLNDYLQRVEIKYA